MKKWLLIIGFGMLLLLPAILDYAINIRFSGASGSTLQAYWRSSWNISHISLFVWFMFFFIAWTSYWTLRVVCQYLPKFVLYMRRKLVAYEYPSIETYAETFAAIHPYISGFIFQIVVLITYDQTFTNMTTLDFWDIWKGNSTASNTTVLGNDTMINTNDTEPFSVTLSWPIPLRNTLLSILCFSTLLLFSKLCLHLFSVKFHNDAYHDRIIENKQRVKDFGALALAYKQLKRENKTSHDFSNRSPSSPPPSPLESIYTLLNSRYPGGLSLKDLKNNFVSSFEGVSSKIEAKVTAFVIYFCILKVNQKSLDSELTLDDFVPFFSSLKEATEAFNRFDINMDGSISVEEFEHIAIREFEEAKDLEESLHSSSAAINKLNSLFLTLSLIIAVFISLQIFGVNLTAFFASFAAFYLGTVFATQGLLQSIVSGLVLLFVTHPFDCGDRIEVNGSQYIVKKFRLLTTILMNGDGKMVYISNDMLSKSFVTNIRRSSPFVDAVGIKCTFDSVTVEKLNALREHLIEFVKERQKDYYSKEANQGRVKRGTDRPSVIAYLDNIIDGSSVTIQIRIEHRYNGQNGAARAKRHHALMIGIRDGLKKCQIQPHCENESWTIKV